MRGKRLNRLLKLIALLRGPTGLNARRLAEKFCVSQRNAYRDIAVLQLAGVPVFHDPDFAEGGAYRIREGFWFPHIGVSDQECLDLSVVARLAESNCVPLLDEVAEVRDKLLGTLPAKQQSLITAASELFDFLSLGLADHSRSRRIMRALQQALLSKRQIEGTYQTPHGAKAVRVRLQPRRVFLSSNANTWYLVAHDNQDGKTKLYRLARFKDIRVSDRPMTISPTFSLREFLGNAWTVYRGQRDYHVEVRFDKEAARLVEEVKWHSTQETEKQPDGSLLFRATVSGLEEIRYWVLQWGPAAIVLKPKELAEEVRTLAQATAANYAVKRR
jgi:predicted DNA-binding transcriptional regulator YafY